MLHSAAVTGVPEQLGNAEAKNNGVPILADGSFSDGSCSGQSSCMMECWEPEQI